MIPKAPRPNIADIGVQAGIWKESSATETSETSSTKGKKRKADNNNNYSGFAYDTSGDKDARNTYSIKDNNNNNQSSKRMKRTDV
ncbi:hypothetical protein NW752_001723 [Fusarium irregulare]|nr:hypothetical protein NW752_001723 [Fusarium irregulare]